MFVNEEKFNSNEKTKIWSIYDGKLYGNYNDYWKELEKPWIIIETEFLSKNEAICRMNAIWLDSKEGKKYQEKDRKNLLTGKYYKEDDNSIGHLMVCHDCKVAYWHSLIHCPFCPNKMIAMIAPRNKLRKIIAEYRIGY